MHYTRCTWPYNLKYPIDIFVCILEAYSQGPNEAVQLEIVETVSSSVAHSRKKTPQQSIRAVDYNPKSLKCDHFFESLWVKILRGYVGVSA